jgi:response regulator RpfG family c-di-GMP phosphodiesterase
MLTGQAQLENAVAAVNEGNIFRLLTKPCSPEELSKTLQAALAQYRLVTSEREILRKTLVGSIQVLTNTLSLINPTAFGQASRLKPLVRRVAKELNLSQVWRLELAAMLSQVGCISLSPGLLEKVYLGKPLSNEERNLFAAHPDVAKDLLIKIPRLEPVARMIALQQNPPKEPAWADNQEEEDLIFMGAHLLKVTVEFDLLVARGLTPPGALAELRKQPDQYRPEIVNALKEVVRKGAES